MTIDAPPIAAIGPAPRAWFGQPRGLFVIAGTELWERISFHGMEALLTLYMVEQLFLPGHIEHVAGIESVRAGVEFLFGPMTTQAFAFQIFGLYVGSVYLTPLLIGAPLGDFLLGRVPSVVLGGLLMAAGHVCMAFETSFFPALLLLMVGAGIFRGNLTPQLGEVYGHTDRRRDVGFQIYGSAVNVGAFIAPIVTGALGYSYGWHAGFGFAAVGMVVGVIVYLIGRPDLPRKPNRDRSAPKQPLTRDEWRRVAFLICLVPAAAAFWLAQSQVWNTYNVWVRDHVDITFYGWTMPVPWLQSLDGIAPLFFMPWAVLLWARQAKRSREPDSFTKMAIGCFLFSAATLFLAAASYIGGVGRASILWCIAFHLVSNIGWLFLSPVIQALFTRLAPASINATMLGVYYLSIFVGSVASGRLGGLYETLPATDFWLVHAAIVAAGGVLFLLLGAIGRRTVLSR